MRYDTADVGMRDTIMYNNARLLIMMLKQDRQWHVPSPTSLLDIDMRRILLVTVLAALAVAVSAWTNEDYEIFDLVSALEAAEGRGTTFYSWLEIPFTATTAEISKAYRKKSILLHPDKNPGVKGIHERFARLGVIAAILRNPEGRSRYDFFHQRGVPTWRGTGYYYSRYRPGIGFVLVFLTILTSGLQYLIQLINYRRDLRRVERIMQDARLAAWGPKMHPVEGKRKVKVSLGGREIDDEGNIAEGKMIDMVVEGQKVYILEPTGELHPLDTSAAVPPSLSSTWFCAMVLTVTSTGARSPRTPVSDLDGEDSSASEEPGTGTHTPKDEGVNTENHVPAVKRGGRRRKVTKKR